jgi:transcription initiation factor TFIID subunit 10
LLRNKDVNDFMVALDDYAPTLPTEVTYYYLGKGGANIHDPRAVKMVSLAADKFMADILFDARQLNLLRQQSNNPRAWAIDIRLSPRFCKSKHLKNA